MQVMRGPPPPPAQKAQELFAKLDTNGDNSVDATELKSLTDYLSEETGTTVDAASLLKAVDSDGDGSISSTEITDNAKKLFDSLRDQLMSSRLGGAQGAQPPDAEQMFASLDTDGDGSLSADEFKAGMQNGPKGPPPAGNDPGRLIAQLLEAYGSNQDSTSSSSSSSTLAVAA
jgi:Ca2+-binding EF-hand superfamily protein